ncbi:hypothetical protein [Endozoicomonas arenosclerae]|uniref:hypothetical protein n=1 Tax=Endozoicomonas arenosclerae TaxID=1633495 RepID=UPI000A51F9F9|nr:hypothetical protein [Endozoicomonas arenosclerae]
MKKNKLSQPVEQPYEGHKEGQKGSQTRQRYQHYEQQSEQQYGQHVQTLYDNHPLSALKRCGTVSTVTAKSVTRIETRYLLEAYSRLMRFFCTDSAYLPVLMTGLVGLPSGRPVSSNTGSLNPSSPVTKSRLRPWVTGSTIRGGHPMAITCRLALLKGNSSRLCNRRVRGYIFLSFNSHEQARKEASRLNAVVCGWQPAGRVSA